MIDIRRLRADPDGVKAALARRSVDLGDIDRAIELDRRERDGHRRARRRAQPGEDPVARGRRAAQGRRHRRRGGAAGREPCPRRHASASSNRVVDGHRGRAAHIILLDTPNLPSDEAPDGAGPEDNPVVRVVGYDPDAYGPHQRVPHWDIGTELGILDLERAAKISGSMFTMLRGAGATLSRALVPARPRPQRRRVRGDPAADARAHRHDDQHRPAARSSSTTRTTSSATTCGPSRPPRCRSPRSPATRCSPRPTCPMRLMAHTAVLPAGGGLGRPRHPRPAARARVRQGRDPRLRHARAGARTCTTSCSGGPSARSRRSASPTASSTSAPATSATHRRAPSTSRSTRPAATSGSRCRRCRGSATTRPDGPTSATGRRRVERPRCVHTLNGSALAVPRVWAAVVETHRQPDGSGRDPRGAVALHAGCHSDLPLGCPP